MKLRNSFMKGLCAASAVGLILDVRLERIGAGHDEEKNSGGETGIGLQRSRGSSLQGEDRGVRVDCTQGREAEALLPLQAG